MGKEREMRKLRNEWQNHRRGLGTRKGYSDGRFPEGLNGTSTRALLGDYRLTEHVLDFSEGKQRWGWPKMGF